MIMEYLQESVSAIPKLTTIEAIIGIPNLLAPPPKLPHPAEVAFAVPTTFGANISEVWTWVMTKEAPMKPMKNLQIRN